MNFKSSTQSSQRYKAIAKKLGLTVTEPGEQLYNELSTIVRQLAHPEKRDAAIQKLHELNRRWSPSLVALCMPAPSSKLLLSAALDYAERGWHVFPMGRNKVPHIKAWQHKASTDPARIKAWWKTSRANVAILCGRASGIVVIDVDTPELPPELERLRRTTTAIVETAHGRHYYFQAPDAPLQTRQFRTFELKAEGSNVTAPPSQHASGQQYTWVRDCTPQPMPDWLLALVQKKKPQPKAKRTGTIPEGERHSTLTSLAGTYRNMGLGYEQILALLQVANKTCRPRQPLEDIKRIAADIAVKDRVRSILLVNAEDIPKLELRWLWPNKIPLGGLSMVIGYEDTGKTWVLGDIAYRVSVGADWPNGSEATEKGQVIICTNEAHMQGRIVKQLDILGADMSQIQFMKMERHGQQFNFAEDFEQLKETVTILGNVRLIIFDPLLQYMVPSGQGQKTLQYADTNRDVGLIAEYFEEEARDLAIIGSNHITKGNVKDPRRMVDSMHGSTAYKAKASTIWCVIAVPDDDELREFVFGIGNVLTRPVYGKAFRLRDDYQVHWQKGNIVEDVEKRLALYRKQEKTPSKRERVRERVLRALAKKDRKVSAMSLQAKVLGDGEIFGNDKRGVDTYKKELTRMRNEHLIDTGPGKIGWVWWKA